MQEKTLVIVNPSSSGGKTKKKILYVERLAQEIFKDCIIIETQRPNHATAITKEYLEKDFTRLIVVGGDGTLNEVVNGFFDANGALINPKATLGLVASGTGGDFRRSLLWRSGAQEDLLRIAKRKVMAIDVGRITARNNDGGQTQRYFINEAGCGLSGMVAQKMAHTTKNLGSMAAYFIATVKGLWNYRAPTLQVTNNKESIVLPNCSLISYGNGQYFGGGMKIAPHARIDDGFLEQIAICNMGVSFFLWNSYKVYTGTHLTLPQVARARVRVGEVKSMDSGDILVQTDGEVIGKLPMKIEILPKALPFLI